MMSQMIDTQIDGALNKQIQYYEKLENMTFSKLKQKLFILEQEIIDCKENNLSSYIAERDLKMIKSTRNYKRGIILKKLVE